MPTVNVLPACIYTLYIVYSSIYGGMAESPDLNRVNTPVRWSDFDEIWDCTQSFRPVRLPVSECIELQTNTQTNTQTNRHTDKQTNTQTVGIT